MDRTAARGWKERRGEEEWGIKRREEDGGEARTGKEKDRAGKKRGEEGRNGNINNRGKERGWGEERKERKE